MKLIKVVSGLKTICCLIFLALCCAFLGAANEDKPSSSHASSPISAVQFQVPEVKEARATLEQRYQAFVRLGHRLVEHGRNPRTLHVNAPSAYTRSEHLVLLRFYLQFSRDEKKALFLDVSPDRQGRILAVPYAANFDQALKRKSWSLLQVHPARPNQPMHIEWYAYVSHLELNPDELAQKLERSSDVKSLRHFLTHPL